MDHREDWRITGVTLRGGSTRREVPVYIRNRTQYLVGQGLRGCGPECVGPDGPGPVCHWPSGL